MQKNKKLSNYNDMKIEEYRQAILEAMIQAKDKEGNPRIDAEGAKELLDDFTNEELEEGMPFNTPEETAEILLED